MRTSALRRKIKEKLLKCSLIFTPIRGRETYLFTLLTQFKKEKWSKSKIFLRFQILSAIISALMPVNLETKSIKRIAPDSVSSGTTISSIHIQSSHHAGAIRSPKRMQRFNLRRLILLNLVNTWLKVQHNSSKQKLPKMINQRRMTAWIYNWISVFMRMNMKLVIMLNNLRRKVINRLVASFSRWRKRRLSLHLLNRGLIIIRILTFHLRELLIL